MAKQTVSTTNKKKTTVSIKAKSTDSKKKQKVCPTCRKPL